MKKIFTVTVLSILTIILLGFSVVNAEVQRIWGVCDGITTSFDNVDKSYDITTETESISAVLADGITLNLGTLGWFTIDNGTITAIETIPEYGYEIAYMADTLKYSYFGDSIVIKLYNNGYTAIPLSDSVRINGNRYRVSSDATTIIDILNSNIGFIGYQYETIVDEETKEIVYTENINNIVTISSKQTVNDIKQGDFSNLTYKMTDSTQYYFMSEDMDETYYQLGELPMSDNYFYSFDVLSYDKDYNARAVMVNEIYSKDIAFYLGSYYASADGYVLRALSKAGEHIDLPLNENCSEREIYNTLSAGIIEYSHTPDGVVTSVSALNNTSDFSDLEVVGDKIGEYNISDIIAFDVVDTGTEERHNWTYNKAEFSDKYIYSGSVYTTSDGITVLWIQSKSEAAGFPVIDFSASNRDPGELRVSADIDLNGYEGNGTVYLAVYKDGRLSNVFTYDLSNTDDISEDYEINKTLYDSDDNEFLHYTVKGFIWNSDLSPILPAVDVAIK